MSFWSRIAAAAMAFKSDAANPSQWLIDWVRGGGPTASGEPVSPQTAMRIGAVFACVRVVSEDVAKLPLILYRRRSDGGKDRATEHPLYQLLGTRPNALQTSFEWREMQQAHVEMRGNGYSYIGRDFRGRPIALQPMHPDKVTVMKAADGAPFYRWQPDNGPAETLSASEVLHVRGLSLDGYVGLSTIAQAREAIGMAAAAEKYGAQFFANDAQPRGILYHPNTLSDKAQANVESDWQKQKSKKDRHKIAVLEEGMRYQQLGLSNDEAQFLETRNLQREEIASFFRVPQHKIGILTRSTFSNIEQQSLEYVTDSLLPRLRRNEGRYNVTLLSAAEQRDYFFEHLVDGLLRADIAARYAAYQIAFMNGFMNANEIRAIENRNPRPGGDEYRVPANTLPSGGSAPDQPAPTPPPESDPTETPAP